MVFGVDEAGKGPAIGPMIAAAVWVEDRDRLPDGIADSKDLAPETREFLAATLRADDAIGIGVQEVTPTLIDAPETDMNGLAVRAHAGAIESALDDAGVTDPENGEALARGVCDACDTDADRFARRVTDRCGIPVAVDARHGADADDRLVGAASIVAKVERDARMAAIAAEYEGQGHGDPGSGYPSDPKTRTFLESYAAARAELPDCARRSWSTCRDVLAEVEQTGLADF